MVVAISITHFRMASTGVPSGDLVPNESSQSQNPSDVRARDSQTTQALTPIISNHISLFHKCLYLQQRLRQILAFERWMIEEEDKVGDDTDAVTILWRTLQRGYPLIEVYNVFNPQVSLSVGDLGRDLDDKKSSRIAVNKFIEACVHELKFPLGECFTLGDLYGDDISGFLKVVYWCLFMLTLLTLSQVVNVMGRILNIMVANGLIEERTETSGVSTTLITKRTQWERIIDDLVLTERSYVQHLKLLHTFKALTEEKGIVSKDSIQDIFANLDTLLAFQQRFHIRVEQMNTLLPAKQRWGLLFVSREDAFRVYDPYIANEGKCIKVVMREFDQLKEVGGSLEMRQLVESPAHLISLLTEPILRLTKYPLLLQVGSIDTITIH